MDTKMDINTLIDNPHYERLVKLADAHGLDLGIMQEMAIGVIDRLEALQVGGVEPTEAHIVAAIHSWTHERQAITERYQTDPQFRAKVQGQVFDLLKDGE